MLNDSDQPMPLRFHVRRRLFALLYRRAQHLGQSVETEASRVLEAALLAVERVDGDLGTDERLVLFTKREVDNMLGGVRRSERARFERQLCDEIAKASR